MASQNPEANSVPPDLFSEGSLRDPALETQLPSSSSRPTDRDTSLQPLDDHPANGDNPLPVPEVRLGHSHIAVVHTSRDVPSPHPDPLSTPTQQQSTLPPNKSGEAAVEGEDNEKLLPPPPDSDSDDSDTASLFDARSTLEEDFEYSVDEDNDLLTQIPSMYRLLKLLYETGSGGQGGLVEKIIIDQKSLGLLLNRMLPGSYQSVSKIDFKALDQLTVKPKGIYGSRPEIAKFLNNLGCIDDKTTRALSKPDEGQESTIPTLRSGLYLVLPPNQGIKDDRSSDAYIIYWPEDTTWYDNANFSAQRNRVTFMRYLTQLTDQIVAVVSDEQAMSFVWDSGTRNAEVPTMQAEDSDDDDDSRMFTFEVSKSEEQEEDVTGVPGFKVEIPLKMVFKKCVELVGSESASGLLVSHVEESKKLTKRYTDECNSFRLRDLLAGGNQNIVLGERLDDHQLRILMDHGLCDKYPGLFASYNTALAGVNARHTREVEKALQNVRDQVENERPEIEQQIRNVTKKRTRQFLAYAATGQPSKHEAYLIDKSKYPFIAQLDQKFESMPPMALIRNDRFQELKAKICIIRQIFDMRSTSEAEQRAIINKVLQERYENLVGEDTDKKSTSIIGKIMDVVLHVTGFKGEDSSKSKKTSWNANKLSDFDFLRGLNDLASAYPVMFELCQQVYTSLQVYLSSQECEFVRRNLSNALSSTRTEREDQAKERLNLTHTMERNTLWTKLWSDVREAMGCTSNSRDQSRHVIHLKSVTRATEQRRDGRKNTEIFIIQTTHVSPTPKQTIYSFFPLELTREDILQCQNVNDFIPRPLFRNIAQVEFKLEEGRWIDFIRPMQDKCLVVLASTNEVSIFMNDNAGVGRAIEAKGYKISLHRDFLGEGPIYAYDEVTRSFVLLYGNEDLKITWLVFDEKFSSLRNRSTISLRGWYEKEVKIRTICFISGTTELCLVDSNGCARVWSLVSEQFGPAYLKIGTPVYHAFSAPDGSCLFVTVENPTIARTELRAFHWASFGETTGFFPARMDPKSRCLITSYESRGRIYLVSMASSDPRRIISTALRVKQKSTEFDFKSKESRSRVANKETINNCLIDCHMEVWSRFPVLPAVARNTLMASVRQPQSVTFISNRSFAGAKDYFTKMVATFERTTQKPTDGRLFAISVQWSPESPTTAAERILCSKFHFGGFIVELLCLIPIHLAVTKENCFIPLKDGVLSPAFQRKLLGADVPNIINSLSIGWYESLFQSYMATKPVRVVSSMGEQSVGKSYCLNHFADTSFAGSAMRTTEGVWLSCTPTDDYLLVSLDFEGVQSIERSAQEDTLLVLFNAAMSNMVLFRNNFAVSRNIASLFKSFQSSATVLDPQLNPGLFNSDLAIIIKDVISSDSKEIVREFSQKFKSIVREEKDQNFMTRLHRGQVHIIPWPVIKSRGFYTLFQRIRDTLERQPVTHGGGGVFLHTLKTLMAKIKANDWGALDKNLASHRAQQLLEWLPDAISRGGIEQSRDNWGPLKNIDTDQELLHDHLLSDHIFWVPSAQWEFTGELGEACERILALLIQKHGKHIGPRHATLEMNYVAKLQEWLFARLDERVGRVQDWIFINVERFPRENQDLRNLLKTLETTVLTARAALQLCASKCSSCHLLCLRPYRHANRNGHDCGTNHNCPFFCDVGERHSESTVCGLQSGHDGRHLCEAGKHTCGQRCMLEDRAGCEFTCVKEIDHVDDHMCSARVHFCGEPCDLRNAPQRTGGAPAYICPGTCQIPWDHNHDRHSCANSQSCPIECQLCPRPCSDKDHFHGLKSDAVHLCGLAHSCTRLCEAQGICQIETQPSAILEQFTGRYESFQYTRYAQEKRRLTCVVPIAPGHVSHDGLHTHSTADVVFHFCDVQCPRCKYYCTLPLGHPQHLHDTSHGSMTETQWFMEGPAASASYELQEHKYGSGDQGSTVLCSMVCTQQGRHVHVDYCRSSNADNYGGEEYRHIDERVLPHPDVAKDWISHQLYWARSGFRDPYSQTEKRNFAKCDAFCADPRHDTSTTAASPSYCKLPILHAPMAPNPNLRSGYVSHDGHLFDCQNPAEAHQSYHILFVIDSSSSMGLKDRRPLSDTPISGQLRSSCDNRYGAVLSALYGFWKSREPLGDASTGGVRGALHLPRTDAYTIISFNSTAVSRISTDLTSTTEQLIDNLVSHGPSGGTSFAAAIQAAQIAIEQNWSNERSPVVIFLSDGECSIGDAPIENLCRMCIRLGMPLAFYTISFGTERRSDSLRKMANVAREVYATARNSGRDISGNPCSYVNAIDSVQLANRFLRIADSLQKPRAALIGSSNNRLQAFM